MEEVLNLKRINRESVLSAELVCFACFFVSARRRQLNEHRHCQQQSSVGGVRRLRVTVHVSFRQTRIEITYELLDVRELLVEIIKPKMKVLQSLDVLMVLTNLPLLLILERAVAVVLSKFLDY